MALREARRARRARRAEKARKAGKPARGSTVRRARKALSRKREPPTTPHLSLVRAPRTLLDSGPMRRRISGATYTVHRWTGRNGRGAPDPARAGFVISEL